MYLLGSILDSTRTFNSVAWLFTMISAILGSQEKFDIREKIVAGFNRLDGEESEISHNERISRAAASITRGSI